MLCQHCGQNNRPQETKCSKCGQPLSANVDTFDMDSLYAPSASTTPAITDGKTAIYVAPEEKYNEGKQNISEASRTIVKPNDSSVAAKTIVKAPNPENVAYTNNAKYASHVDPSSTSVNTPIQEDLIPSMAHTVIGEGLRVEKVNKTVCQTIIKCSYCGYFPILNSVTECPQCKKPILPREEHKDDVASEAMQSQDNPSFNNVYEKPEIESKVEAQGTICRPFYLNTTEENRTEPEINATFRLTLIPEDGEQTTAVTKQYKGNEVLLNRDNTEPSNLSITSKEQALIKYEEGQWYVENRSQLKTTYVVVDRRIELHDGDVVILGNRKFRFGV